MIHSKSYYRDKALVKARRKRNICLRIYGSEWYSNLHQYSKNKIHCSCPLCRGESWSFGANSIKQRVLRDQKRIEQMFDEEEEFYESELLLG